MKQKNNERRRRRLAAIAWIGLVGGASQAAAASELSGFDCLIAPYAVVEVGTREQGVLEDLEVDRGDAIEKGQVLARLESGVERLAVQLARTRAEMTANLEARKTNVAYLARQLKRVDDLYQKKALPFQERDQAATDLALGKLQVRESQENMRLSAVELKRAEEALSRRTVRSPINGVVMERLIAPGELVDERPVVKVAQIVPLNVEVILPVEFYDGVVLGMKADIKPLIPDGGTHVATVTAVDPVVDAASNTFGVRLELPNQDRAIPGGIRCEVRFLPR
jgi:RND family efflux transporter MFP subunit